MFPIRRNFLQDIFSLSYTVKEIHSEWTHTMIDVDLGEPEKVDAPAGHQGKAEVNMNLRI